MPHATNNDDSQPTMTNGSRSPSSQFLSHLSSYPVVSDGLATFRDNPYGKKSLEIADGVYARLGKPVEPYLEKPPISYARPYVARADELADSGLGHVETHFPIVKEDTSTIVDKGKAIAYYPFSVAHEGRNYLLNTWNDEYTKTAKHNSRGSGVGTTILAIISTELRLASDFFQAVADILGPKYNEAKDKTSDLAASARDQAQGYKQLGEEKLEQARGTAEQYRQLGEEKVQELRKVGASKAGEVSEQVQKSTGAKGGK